MSAALTSNTGNQFLTLDFLKSTFKITDTQDDDTLLGIVQASNLEVKKRVIAVLDSLILEGTIFFQPAQDAALVYAESEIKRKINLMFTEAKDIMERFEGMMETLIGEIRATAPVRTSRRNAKRDDELEDDFFAERRFV